jgi:hypothetical protein
MEWIDRYSGNQYRIRTTGEHGTRGTMVMPALQRIPLKAWERDTGKSQVVLIDARRGRRRPHAKHRALLVAYARKRGLL